MNFFDYKDLGNHLLQLCPKVVKHPVCIYCEVMLKSHHRYALQSETELRKDLFLKIETWSV